MFSRLTGHMRHNVVAYLALFVALGGTSYAAIKLPANSVGAKQIKTNAVRSSDVKNASLAAIDFKAGQLPVGPRGTSGANGATGPKGGPGAPGANGTNGTQGPAGISGYEVFGPCNIPGTCTATFFADPNVVTNGSLSCPANKKVIGGGYIVASAPLTAAVHVRESRPLLDGTGWWVSVANATASGVTMRLYATCANVTS